MSTISAGTTLTTALVQTGDTNGNLVFKTGASGTTALTLGADQSATFAGAVSFSGGAFAAGSASAPSITFTGDTNTGIFSPAADTIAFTEGGVESMRIDSAGNVGIGTSSPSTRLDVRGTIVASDGGTQEVRLNTDGNIEISRSDGVPFIDFKSSTAEDYDCRIQQVSNGLNFQTGGNGSASERMRIDSSGNVGIGTSSPDQRLDVRGSGAIIIKAQSSNSSAQLILNSSGTNVSYINYGQTGANPLAFYDSNAATERMRIDSSGNVGIGTTNILKRVSIEDNNSSTTTTTGLSITNFNSTVDSRAGITFRNFDNYGAAIWSRRTGSTAGDLCFGTNVGAGSTAETQITERMRIDSSGNLLVNTTTQFGAGRISVRYVPGVSTGVSFLPTTDSSGPTPLIFLNAAGSAVGSVTTTGSATAYNTSSDYRLKENIAPMTGALSKVSQLKPCTYTWKIDGSQGQGFIAHELAEVVPECVTGEKDAVDAEGNPVYQGIDTSFLIATLTAAIQEQQAIINDLKTRIEQLEAK